MGRWEPNARGRLQRAALELYMERGYEQTTVADIAARAGLTERTFFRHFADKREVLFRGDELAELMTAAIDAQPPSASPLDAACAAVAAPSTFFTDRRIGARMRRTVIATNPGLQERELIKLASLAAQLRGALRRRGVGEPTASVTAETAIAVFKLAFERWLDDAGERSLAEHVTELFDELRTVARQ